MKRVFFFVLTNLAILIVLSTVMSLLGVRPYLTQYGLDYESLLIFAAIFGMGGAFISLALSKWMAKRFTRARVITDPRSEGESWLVNTVADLARQSNIGMPEVAVFPSEDQNAFATGMRKNRALVAVSQGLLENMDRAEVRAVLAHEVSHVANGDMVTLTLIQGVINTFVIFLSRVIGYAVDRVVLKNERGHGIGFWVATIASEIVLAILASIIVFWFSRRREFRADSGAAGLVGKKPMMGALEALKASVAERHLPDSMASFGISGGRKRGLMALFATHPPLDDRIRALAQSRYPEYR